MARGLRCTVAGVVLALSVGSCHNTDAPGHGACGTVAFLFQIELDRRVYENSAWGDPPQMAIWLQNETDESIRTVAVTHRTGAGDWEGKVECSVALPCWVMFYNRETTTEGPPTWDHPAPDAITCATPRAELHTVAQVPRGTHWTYFVEVNVSGDYNAHFPRLSEDGLSDRYGNGQPSVVYRGWIEAREGQTSRPELWGRTDQHRPVDTVNTDLHEMTTAGELLRTIAVSCAANAGD